MQDHQYSRLIADASGADLTVLVELLRAAQRRADRLGMQACLEGLRDSWQRNRYPELATLIRRLGEILEGPIAADLRVAAKGKKGKLKKVPQSDFLRAVHQAPLADRGAVLDLLATGTIKEVGERAALVVDWPSDPRVTEAYLGWLNVLPFGSLAGKSFWNAGFKMLMRDQDPRTLSRLPAVEAEGFTFGIGDTMDLWLREKVAKVRNALADVKASEPSDADQEALQTIAHFLDVGMTVPEPINPATHDEAEGRRVEDALTRALAAAHKEPGELQWDQVCAALDEVPDGELDDALLVRVNASLSAWPDSLRVAPGAWLAPHFRKSKPASTPKLAVCREVDLSLVNRTVAASVIPKALGHAYLRDITVFRFPSLTDDLAIAIAAHPSLTELRPARIDAESLLVARNHGLAEACGNTMLLHGVPPMDDSLLQETENLSLSARGNHKAELIAFFQTASLPALRSLSIDGLIGFGPELFDTVFQSRGMPNLQSLHLERVAEGMALTALAENPGMAKLTALGFSVTQWNTPDWSPLIETIGPRLESLRLPEPSLRDFERLAACTQLRSLQIESGPEEVTPEQLGAVLRAMPNLVELSIQVTGGGFDDQHLDAIIENAPNLRTLGLNRHQITAAGAAAIGAATWELHSLTLSGSQIGDDGLTSLLAGELPTSLRALFLSNCSLKSKSGKPLANAPFQHLEHLDLSYNYINRKAAELLAGASWIRRLYRSDRNLSAWAVYPLDLSSNPIGAHGRTALERAVGHGLTPKST